MSSSFGKSRQKSSQSSQQQSNPLTPEEVAQYFGQLDELTGGRLGSYAKTGTKPATAEEIQALGGLGATRRLEAEQARGGALDRIVADPSLTLAQRQRSSQLSDRDYSDRLDAIAKETEAAKTGLAQQNAKLTREDMELLAQIFFGGKGQRSSGTSSGSSSGRSYNFGASIPFPLPT